MTPIEILSSLGGLVTFVTAMFLLARGIFRQVSAIEDNTECLNNLKSTVESIARDLHAHDVRISVLESKP